MMYFRTLAGSTALTALVVAGQASADVTPELVWQSWQEMGAAAGQGLTAANQSRSGNTLKLEGVRLHFEQPGMLIDGVIPEVNLTQRGDGTVEITMSPEFPVDMTVQDDPEEGAPPPEPTTVELTIRQPGLVMVAAGDGGAVSSVKLNAPSSTVAITKVDGVDAKTMDLVAEISLSDLGGTYRTEGADKRAITSDFTAAVAEMTFAMTDPENGGKANVRASATDIKGTSAGQMIGPIGMTDLAGALRDGATSNGRFTYGPATVEFDVTDATDRMKGSSSVASGHLEVGMNEGGLSYKGGAKGVNLTLSGNQIPFPSFNMSYAEAAFELLAPVVKADAPQGFRLLTKVVDLKVSDEIWAMFDPMKQLPRDPATLVVDATGTAKLDVDLLDPVAVEQLGGKAPGTLESLSLQEMKLTLAGATLTGNGGFIFDNTDTTTFNGMPAPTGKLDMKLVGANALIDKLVAIGLVPNDQAMGARMMLGMFARPGEGQDTLTSTLEFKDKGFYANGQRLQ